jgi:quinol monooxygenase YgiN
MTKFAIYAELKAKPGKGEEVAAFLADARSLVLNELETVAWFAIRFDDRTFGIFDTFNEESGRRAHLSGPIAKALISRAAELLEAMPTIRQPDVIADKLPS